MSTFVVYVLSPSYADTHAYNVLLTLLRIVIRITALVGPEASSISIRNQSDLMAFVEHTTPVNACFLVKCDKCAKTTWKVRFLRFLSSPPFTLSPLASLPSECVHRAKHPLFSLGCADFTIILPYILYFIITHIDLGPCSFICKSRIV